MEPNQNPTPPQAQLSKLFDWTGQKTAPPTDAGLRASALAQADLDHLQRQLDADRIIKQWTDKARDLGKGFEDIYRLLHDRFGPELKALGISNVSQLKHKSHEFNMSLSEITKLHPKEWITKWEGIGESVLKIAGPLETLNLAIKGVIGTFNLLQRANQDFINVMRQQGLGNVSTNISRGQRIEAAQARFTLAGFGIHGKEATAAISASASEFSKAFIKDLGSGNALKGSVEATLLGQGAVARGVSPQTAGSLAQLAYASGKTKDFGKELDEVTKLTYASNEKMMADAASLGSALRYLGGDATRGGRMLSAYNRELIAQRIHGQDIAAIANKSMSSFGSIIKLITLAKNYGVKLPAGAYAEDPYKAAGAMMEFIRDDTHKGYEKLLTSLTGKMATGATGENIVGSRALIEDSVLREYMVGGMAERIRFPGGKGAGAATATDIENLTKSIDELKKEMEAQRKAGRGALGLSEDIAEQLKEAFVILQQKYAPTALKTAEILTHALGHY